MAFRIRITLLIVLLCVFIYPLAPVQQFKEDVLNYFDKRPGVSMLLIGNSRVFWNAMPLMINDIADSAHSQKKYEILTHAPAGVSFEDHWQNTDVQRLLQKKWDYVILQGRSNEQLDNDSNDNFMTYGKKLADLAVSHGSRPALLVAWRYGDGYPLYDQQPKYKTTLQGLIQDSYAKLSKESGAPEINVGEAWEKLRTAAPNLRLYDDLNHPSMAGSYLTALMCYRFMSHDDLRNVSYVPRGVSAQDAKLIRSIAESEVP